MLDAGLYSVVPYGGTLDTCGQKASPLLRVHIQVNHYAQDEQWIPLDQPEQRELRLFLTDGAWPYTEKKLRALGFNGDFDEPRFAGEAINAICKHRAGKDENAGKTFEDWDLAEWGESREAQPPDRETVRLLERKWKTAEATDKKPAGQPAAPPRTPAPAAASATRETNGADDIPF